MNHEEFPSFYSSKAAAAAMLLDSLKSTAVGGRRVNLGGCGTYYYVAKIDAWARLPHDHSHASFLWAAQDILYSPKREF